MVGGILGLGVHFSLAAAGERTRQIRILGKLNVFKRALKCFLAFVATDLTAFDVSVSLWPSAWIELRQDARVIEKHGAHE